jgi:hypothetical protein
MDRYLEWFKDNKFLQDYGVGELTVVKFLFRSSDYEKAIRSQFNYFINAYVYDAHNTEFIPIDLTLQIIGVDDIMQYMREQFTKRAKVHMEVMSYNVPEFLAEIFCEEAKIHCEE